MTVTAVADSDCGQRAATGPPGPGSGLSDATMQGSGSRLTAITGQQAPRLDLGGPIAASGTGPGPPAEAPP